MPASGRNIPGIRQVGVMQACHSHGRRSLRSAAANGRLATKRPERTLFSPTAWAEEQKKDAPKGVSHMRG